MNSFQLYTNWKIFSYLSKGFSKRITFNDIVSFQHFAFYCSRLCQELLIKSIFKCEVHGLLQEVGSLSLLQGIFQTQELTGSLWSCRWILYQLSYQGCP